MSNRNYKPSKALSKAFVAAVRETPGILIPDLAKALNVHESTISLAGRVLVRRGRITRKRVGRFMAHYPAEPKAIDAQPPVPADIVELAEIASLRDEVEELRAFKARVIAQYPDLDVSPLVLEARKIAYRALFDAGNRDVADSTILGEADNSPFIRAIVTALQRTEQGEA